MTTLKRSPLSKLGLLNFNLNEAFYIGETGQMHSKHMNGHWSTCTIVNSDISVLIYTKSISYLFRNAVCLHHIMSNTNLKLHINSHFNPYNLLVLTPINLTLLSPTPFTSPHYSLTASASWSVFFYSWWKPQCWLKAHVSLSILSKLSILHGSQQTWVN